MLESPYGMESAMDFNKIAEQHHKVIRPETNVSPNSFLLFASIFVIVSLIIIFGIPATFGEAGEVAVIAIIAIVLLATIIEVSDIGGNGTEEIFNNPENHTHDDNCPTCGELYGPTRPEHQPNHVRTAAYVCRHASGQMKYTR